jgi:hypothetical protein
MNTNNKSAPVWITFEENKFFKAFCISVGLDIKDHPDIWKCKDYVVRFQGHWMAVSWNKHNDRYTLDRRLKSVLKAFKG